MGGDGRTKVSVRLEDESAASIRNILAEGELEEAAVVKEYLTTAADGKGYRVKHYNLDMILAVGPGTQVH